MTTETEAREIQTAIEAFQARDLTARQQQIQQDIVTAQAWFDSTIRPRLTWRTTQAPRLQFTNILADREALIALNDTRIRMSIIQLEIRKITERITTIKAAL